MDTARPPLLDLIERSVIGSDEAVEGPWGVRRITYADYTASGRALSFIEDFIRERVLPFYANTHTETSDTGKRTTRLREDARDALKRACGGNDDDIVIFCGSGSTGAVHRVVGALGLCLPPEMERRHHVRDMIPEAERPVVFIGPYEHHSNELPWRDSIADVVCVCETPDGQIDLEALERALEEHEERPLKIGSFSAASNVTGIVSDVRGVSACLHRHGALAFWDFAAAGPYRAIRMHPDPESPEGGDDPLAYMDAVFLSPHKLVGGPGTPGVLVARRELFQNPAPAWPGGGTVAFVTDQRHHYHHDPVHREEAGTPAIVESIRAGLVFRLKEAVGEELIEARERRFVRRALERWGDVPSIEILGNTEAERLAIVSFRVRHGPSGDGDDDGGRFLHHEFVGAVLNDLLGIQARSGCSCAGPYGTRLLQIPEPRVEALSELVLQGWEGVKPGWIRVNFNYFITDEEFDFIVDGVELVAREGWKLLADYRFEPRTGRWTHRDRDSLPEALSLDDVSFQEGGMRVEAPERIRLGREAWPRHLEEAREILGAADPSERPSAGEPVELPPEVEAMRWFVLPHEVAGRSGAGV